MVGSNVGVAAKTAEVAKANFEKLGFQVQMRLVQPQTMYTRYCNTPSADVAVCPNVGWLKDFADGQTMLYADVQRQEHPRAGQLELVGARRPDDQRGDGRGRAPPEGAARRGLGRRSTSRSRRQAPAIPWIWDKTPLIQSENVNGVASCPTPQWDLAWTSLK